MAYVLKTHEGKYLRSKDAWSVTLTDDIFRSRIYPRKQDATRSSNNQGRYNRKPIDLLPVEVEVRELTKHKENK